MLTPKEAVIRTLEEEQEENDKVYQNTQASKEALAKKMIDATMKLNEDDFEFNSIKGAQSWTMMHETALKTLESIEKTRKDVTTIKLKAKDIQQKGQSNELLGQYLRQLKQSDEENPVIIEKLNSENDQQKIDKLFNDGEFPKITEAELRDNPNDLS